MSITVNETLARVTHVIAITDGNGIFSTGSRAALQAMAAHWKDHLGEGHPATIITDDIDGLIEHLKNVKQELLPAGEAPVSPLAAFSDTQLIDELTGRGMVVSAWSREDLSDLDDAEWAVDLTDSQLDAVKDKVLEEAGRSLSDILGTRGNTHLNDWCFDNHAKLEKWAAEAITMAPGVDEAVQDVVDDVRSRAKKHDFTLDEHTVRDVVQESAALLRIELAEVQIDDACEILLRAKD